jgi:hypothetical protein
MLWTPCLTTETAAVGFENRNFETNSTNSTNNKSTNAEIKHGPCICKNRWNLASSSPVGAHTRLAFRITWREVYLT